MLRVFVINLDRSTSRWQSTSAKLKSLDISFERFAAIDGFGKPHPLFSRYDDKLRQRYRRKPLSSCELGCFSSHFLLWEKCINLNEPIVVMEDDVVIDENIVEALNIAAERIGQLGYLRLAGTSMKHRRTKKIETLGSFDLIDHIRGPSGALCYVIHPNAASLLIKQAQVWFIAVDDYMDRYWLHGVDCLSLMPFPIRVGDNESTMFRQKKTYQPFFIKLRKELCTVLEVIRRTWYRVITRSIKRSI